MKSLISIVIAVTCMVAFSTASAVTLFQEDFEGLSGSFSNGQNVATQVGNMTIEINGNTGHNTAGIGSGGAFGSNYLSTGNSGQSDGNVLVRFFPTSSMPTLHAEFSWVFRNNVGAGKHLDVKGEGTGGKVFWLQHESFGTDGSAQINFVGKRSGSWTVLDSITGLTDLTRYDVVIDANVAENWVITQFSQGGSPVGTMSTELSELGTAGLDYMLSQPYTGARNYRMYFDDMLFTDQAVPEPATMALLGVGGMIALVRRRR